MKDDSRNWVILPPGNRCLLRRPALDKLPGTELASVRDIITANGGAPFPWGWRPTTKPVPGHPVNKLWKQHRLGHSGLYHEQWFVCQEGRVGGAANVPEDLPGSLRSCLYLDGGNCAEGLAENEGYALIRPTTPADADMYRKVMFHAAERIMADRGNLIVTPIDANGIVSVGFSGRCLTCPNPLEVTIKQLQDKVPGYQFKPLPEWDNWSLEYAA